MIALSTHSDWRHGSDWSTIDNWSHGHLSYSFSSDAGLAPTLCTSFPHSAWEGDCRPIREDRPLCPSAASPETENENEKFKIKAVPPCKPQNFYPIRCAIRGLRLSGIVDSGT